MRICNRCKIEKPLDLYPRHPTAKSGRSAICKACKVEKNQLSKFSLTTAKALEITSICHLCNKELKNTKICIDHDHNTNLVRGILCSSCNTGLGLLGDNIENLERALVYLKNPPMLNEQF